MQPSCQPAPFGQWVRGVQLRISWGLTASRKVFFFFNGWTVLRRQNCIFFPTPHRNDIVSDRGAYVLVDWKFVFVRIDRSSPGAHCRVSGVECVNLLLPRFPSLQLLEGGGASCSFTCCWLSRAAVFFLACSVSALAGWRVLGAPPLYVMPTCVFDADLQETDAYATPEFPAPQVAGSLYSAVRRAQSPSYLRTGDVLFGFPLCLFANQIDKYQNQHLSSIVGPDNPFPLK